MLEIALTICSLLANNGTCKDVSIALGDETTANTPYVCMMGAMQEIQKYIQTHPNWSVSKWKCQPAGMVAKI